MAGAQRRAKDAAMAAQLKKDGVVRHSAACPMCHALINLKQLQGHITLCGRGEKTEKKSKVA